MQNDIILKSPDKFLNVVQEQINNIVKHASAKNVVIRLRSNQARIFLLIEDDGKGFDTKNKKAGIGLSNMRSRVESLDGEIEITFLINKGSVLKMNFPIVPYPGDKVFAAISFSGTAVFKSFYG